MESTLTAATDDIQLASLAVSTEVGDVKGLGIIFGSASHADDVLRRIQDYYETPSFVHREFAVEFTQNADGVTAEIRIISASSASAIKVGGVVHTLVDDLTAALNERPYFFIIACVIRDGEVVPYRADQNFIAKGNIAVDGSLISGNSSGSWPSQPNPFR